MKILFSLFAVIIMTKECNNKTNSSEEKLVDAIENTSEKNKLQNNITFEYKAISRGFYYSVVISESAILVQKNLNSKAISKNCSKENWSKLMALLNTIDLKNITTFKAPTQARLYDGAATAQLIIKQEKDLFETNSFDHNNPPLEIEALVKKILSLSEIIE